MTQDLERFFSVGVGLGGLVLALVAARILFWVWGFAKRFLPAPKPKALPRHKVATDAVEGAWPDEAAYDRTLTGLFEEVREAMVRRDLETLEVVSRGSAFEFFKAHMERLDLDAALRDQLQGSVREFWDPKKEELVIVLAVLRYAGGWRRGYEEWVLQRQGRGWFVVDARHTKL